MIKLSTVLTACLISICSWAQDFNKSMAEVMESMKTYTIEMVTLMPEDKWDYKPVDSVRTFREQVQHMISTNYFLLNFCLIGDQKGDPEAEVKKSFSYAEKRGKSEIISLLKEQFDKTIAFFRNSTPKHYSKMYAFGTPDHPILKDYFTTAMLIRDHISHHRSQLIVYLRLNGIVPAEFRGF